MASETLYRVMCGVKFDGSVVRTPKVHRTPGTLLELAKSTVTRKDVKHAYVLRSARMWHVAQWVRVPDPDKIGVQFELVGPAFCTKDAAIMFIRVGDLPSVRQKI